jgi:hypothetical protein
MYPWSYPSSKFIPPVAVPSSPEQEECVDSSLNPSAFPVFSSFASTWIQPKGMLQHTTNISSSNKQLQSFLQVYFPFITPLLSYYRIDFGYPVLLVANLFHPVCHVAVKLFPNGDLLPCHITFFLRKLKKEKDDDNKHNNYYSFDYG